jgi:putative SOS response-associated peptidase YedK
MVGYIQSLCGAANQLTLPLAFFAGIWTTAWTSVRKVKDGVTGDDIYTFLNCSPNALVEQFHPKAMPVILTSRDEVEQWLTAPTQEVLKTPMKCPWRI